MGLDMYLNGKKYFWSTDTPVKEDGYELKEKELRIGYWRKHPNLHGFIVEQFAGGDDNCEPISLDRARIEKIIDYIKSGDIRKAKVKGFFFGSSYDDEDETYNDKLDAETIETFEKALSWVEQKEPLVSRHIEYQASW